MTKKILLSLLFIIIFLPATRVFAGEEKEMLLVDPSEQQEEFNAQFLFCNDSKCGEEKKEFFAGDAVFIDYKAENRLPMLAIITTADKKKESTISIPGFYVFENKGEYSISFKLLVDGFQKIHYKKKIIVQDSSNNNLNNNKNKIEAKTNDINKQENISHAKSSTFQIIIFIILFISIILIIFLAYFFLIRKKPRQNQK